MCAETISISVRLEARQDRADEVAEALKTLVAATRPEEGCLQYAAHRNVDNPTLFFLFEHWANQQCLSAHEARPHLPHFLKTVASCLVRSPDVTTWKQL